ncbi:DNA topoisomerase IB [Rubrivivax gelatinosus]|uniref:DNA topoisomerase n=1 Tax=Rubrivivax gelatinosus (strain NBRC 100245 / IL144) TaxID=983917 RepID=I0HS35_RUBGI|nr:DNA topoisomerase IB [Rubrivivax gelatinosus]BAL95822.1 putative DNA topoisomerase, type I [Rubrivivax gelatinosus IL144]
MPLDATPPPGLVSSGAGDPGIRRLRRRGGFAYVDADGRPVRDAATLERIRRLVLPPAWEEVWICADARGHLQATGRDARGRTQYRYHADWAAHRGLTKFERLREFGARLPVLRARIGRVLASGDEPTRERVLATLVRLLDTTWMRIGNDEYARLNGSFGLSTLRDEHARVRGDSLRLSFVGKGGVRHEVAQADRRVARVVRRCRELPGQELFQWVDADGSVRRVGSGEVNAWLAEAAGVPLTAKDFRTWHGSVAALALTLEACASTSPGTPAAVVKAVARRLGNTPAVCRKAYVHPRVLALADALAGDLADGERRCALLERAWVKRPAPVAGLSTTERRLLALLATPPRRAGRPAR